jgi:hypothetical protein
VSASFPQIEKLAKLDKQKAGVYTITMHSRCKIKKQNTMDKKYIKRMRQVLKSIDPDKSYTIGQINDMQIFVAYDNTEKAVREKIYRAITSGRLRARNVGQGTTLARYTVLGSDLIDYVEEIIQ